ncbi:MAG: Orotate phosphoribosyltransferase [Acidimicrobiales bacterium]|nr:MAG: orotate phosphoribosyltransferase [Actinomycetota bacterium]MBV6509750.1 Orotate phosphoribosyltransferase [Acidimicrobiales bacterium]RIK04856.1 MAG: orotate phosphoribosyltransferase [Acidobacteriota bacterium]
MASKREELVRHLRDNCLEYREEPFELSSGALSHWFCDGKRALAQGHHLALACNAMTEAMSEREVGFDSVGGMTMGADQFAHGIAVLCDTKWFVVRKQPKGRGTDKLIEGARLDESSRVLMVEDVVTTGGSMLKAVDVVRATGATIVAATALIDRGSGLAERFRSENITYLPLATNDDLGIPAIGEEAARSGSR